jgi:hypothetical protein
MITRPELASITLAESEDSVPTKRATNGVAGVL